MIRTPLFWLIVVTFGCKQECLFKHLPPRTCDTNYSMIAEGGIGDDNFLQELASKNSFPPRKIVIINDDSTYEANYDKTNPYRNSFGAVDFSLHSIVAINVYTNPGTGAVGQVFLCKNINNRTIPDKWRLTVHYSLENQCAGSHIRGMKITFSLLCRKLPSNADIETHVVDINPFQ